MFRIVTVTESIMNGWKGRVEFIDGNSIKFLNTLFTNFVNVTPPIWTSKLFVIFLRLKCDHWRVRVVSYLFACINIPVLLQVAFILRKILDLSLLKIARLSSLGENYRSTLTSRFLFLPSMEDINSEEKDFYLWIYSEWPQVLWMPRKHQAIRQI